MEYLGEFKTLKRQIFHIFYILQINSTAIPPYVGELFQEQIWK